MCTVRGTITDGSPVKGTVELKMTERYHFNSGEFGTRFSAVHEEIGVILGVIYTSTSELIFLYNTELLAELRVT